MGRSCSVISDSVTRLQNYKEHKAKLPPDSDGAYLIIKGQAKIVNKWGVKEPTAEPHNKNRKDQGANVSDILKKDCHFGLSKFLKEQSYTYFGDIIAYSPEAQSPPKSKKQKETKCEEPKEPATVCLFIPKQKLYLIPFYDLKMLRGEIQSDKDLKALRHFYAKACREDIRKMKLFQQKRFKELNRQQRA